MRHNWIVSAAMWVALASTSYGASPQSFDVSTELLYRGEAFAAPSAIVNEGVPATIEVSGPDGYQLALTVTSLSADQIKVVADLVSSRGTLDPTLIVRPDKPAIATVGDMGLKVTVRRGVE